MWGLIRFFVTTYLPEETLDDTRMVTFLQILLNMQSYGASGQAFWNCILFCFCDKTVRQALKNWITGSCEERELLVPTQNKNLYTNNSALSENESS